MIKGIYIADTRMNNCNYSLDMISNNITNASTTGFKKQGVTFSPFGDYLTYQVGKSRPLGKTNHGVNIEKGYTMYEQGTVKETGNPLDIAIEGDGFFAVREPDGAIRLTRDGHFSIDQKGYLTDSYRNVLMGKKGPIQAGGKEMIINTSGEIILNGAVSDTLSIICPQEKDGLKKLGDNLYELENRTADSKFEGQIKQGFLEMSNVDVVKEMSDMIENARAFQSCSKLIQMMDQVLNKSVNEIARL